MSKIICDLCGTSYPDTDTQCPICGTAKTDTSKQPAGGEENSEMKSKAGAFATVGMKKSDKPEKKAEPKREPAPKKQKNEYEPEERRSNLGLVIVVIILVIAIIAVCAIIAGKFINSENPNTSSSTPAGSSSSTPAQTLPCTQITLSQTEYVFSAKNQLFMLTVDVLPLGTTDTISFESSDPNIVAVTQEGVVTPVADGEATIIVRCGDIVAECAIVCENIDEPIVDPTDPTDPTDPPQPTDPAGPAVELALNREEFTLTGYGSSWKLTSGSGYSGPDDPSLITWTSSKPEVATVTNGKVVAVGNGYTWITAEYQGQSVKCKVICTKVDSSLKDAPYKLSHTDVTLEIGRPGWESFRLSLVKKEDGSKIAVTFTSADESICTVSEKGTVTAVSKGSTVVYVEYEGVTYKCRVIVNGQAAEPEVPENP